MYSNYQDTAVESPELDGFEEEKDEAYVEY
jgi:hypothetical protein